MGESKFMAKGAPGSCVNGSWSLFAQKLPAEQLGFPHQASAGLGPGWPCDFRHDSLGSCNCRHFLIGFSTFTGTLLFLIDSTLIVNYPREDLSLCVPLHNCQQRLPTMKATLLSKLDGCFIWGGGEKEICQIIYKNSLKLWLHLHHPVAISFQISGPVEKGIKAKTPLALKKNAHTSNFVSLLGDARHFKALS